MSLHVNLSKAKAKLLLDQPYLGTLASRLELVASDRIGAVLCDGMRLEYNDSYLEALSLDELCFVLANGAMHAVLAHEQRQKARLSWLWQLATDHAINAMLVHNGMSAPQGVAYEPRFEGMYAEEIYAQLRSEIKNESYSDDESNDVGYNENHQRRQKEQPRAPQGEEAHNRLVQEVEARLGEAILEQLHQEALSRAGDALPQGLERFFSLTCKASIDWRSELHHVLDRFYRSDYRMMPPSKKLLYAGVYLPSLAGEHLNLSVAIDTSGSVDEVRLGRFIDELESLLNAFSDVTLTLYVADDRIREVRSFERGEKVEYRLIGGGGTDFRPVIAAAAQSRLLLYFTDLQGTFGDAPSECEVIWIAPEAKAVPFGRVIVCVCS
ncbi:MAG: hypothetical protein JXK05_09820 [Campylobacterales bacterium]|nr:hypothetical protein [Campylobacterales bacterium]